VLERDDYQCQVRLPGCRGIATTVDHIIPAVDGGTADPDNLRAACGHCNFSRGIALGRERAQRRFGRRP
jgi:5-methylcytosine-specific restriction endonuclease McrA